MINKKHPEYIGEVIKRWVVQKYEAGQIEHGGDLRRKAVNSHIRAEIADLVVYWVTLEDQIQEVFNLLELALTKETAEAKDLLIEAVLNILDSGNIQGEAEEELNEDTVYLHTPQLTLWDED
jgi:hypothetical protein